MEDNRKLKTLVFEIVDGTNKRGRPCREWMDDIVSWCKTGLQELNSLAHDRRRWKLITRQWTPTGAGPMVPEEKESMYEESVTTGPLISEELHLIQKISMKIRCRKQWRWHWQMWVGLRVKVALFRSVETCELCDWIYEKSNPKTSLISAKAWTGAGFTGEGECQWIGIANVRLLRKKYLRQRWMTKNYKEIAQDYKKRKFYQVQIPLSTGMWWWKKNIKMLFTTTE